MTPPIQDGVPEEAVEQMAAQRWDAGRNPDADSPSWAELSGCDGLKESHRAQARSDLNEAAQFLHASWLGKLGSDEVRRIARDAFEEEQRQHREEPGPMRVALQAVAAHLAATERDQ